MISQLHIHRMGNSLYASEAAQGEDRDVKAFAARGVPVGKEHLQHAAELAQALGGFVRRSDLSKRRSAEAALFFLDQRRVRLARRWIVTAPCGKMEDQS